MKKIIGSLLICFVAQALYGQVTRKNVIYADFLGSAVSGIGLGYERYFPVSPRINLTARAGGGLVDGFSQFSPHFGGSVLYGKRSALEIGFNQIYNYDAGVFKDEELIGPNDGDEIFQPFMGYRYKNENSGIMFRVFLVPPLRKFANFLGLPYPGLSLGYSF